MRRVDPEFLTRSDTIKSISEIAGAQSLVVYVGSGVTVDDTSLTWYGALTEIADKVGLQRDRLELLRPALDAPQLASTIMDAYKERFGANRARVELASALATALYNQHEWKNSFYSRSLVLACAQLAKAGVDVIIVTTNYDNFIEQRARELLEDGLIEGVTFPSYLLDDEDSEDATDVAPSGEDIASEEEDLAVPVVHLHGYVSDTHVQPPVERIVFSELDYYRTELRVFDVLNNLLSVRPTLIVGSALNDVPLIRALADTAGVEDDQLPPRWAIVPRQGLPAEIDPFGCEQAEDDNDVLVDMDGRMRQLRVKAVFPNFFHEAPQMLREAGLVADLKREGKRYTPSVQFGKRTEKWWRDWTATGARRHGSLVEFQAACHRRLAAAVEPVQDALGGRSAPTIKIEFWVREGLSDQLTLWASSTGTWPDTKTARRASIEANSAYPAARIFTSGTAELVPAGDASDRWEQYFGLPVLAGDGVRSVPVGVITVATGKRHRRAAQRLSHDRREGLMMTAQDLRQVGAHLLDLDPAAPVS